ncbi:uncharacterized protein LOC126703097 [Quercus robur]|uniref:uncharacterized protein LOC126703097 n=1 Tax=Quercus robur TaxID=38942 RepID=UPI0021611D5A|nr:uncharacterized protein LOC126703097 [Quercus robur]
MRAFLCAIDESVWDSVKNGISHVEAAKEAWTILETIYEGTKKVKDTKLQMLTTRFEELKMGDNESFNSVYGKLNKISFREKVTAIEESKDLDEIKIQELIGSLQTYELGLPSRKTSKSLALKTITERMNDSSKEDDVEKEVAFLAKNFRKFIKMKNSGKPFSKGKFSSSKSDRKEFKKKDGKDFQSPQGIVCYECNFHGHLKKECPNYVRGKGKVFATTLSDFDSSNSDTEGECDSEGNYRAFMTIASVDSKNDLSNLVDELGDLSEDEEIEESEDERISTKKLDNVLSFQKSSHDKTSLGYTKEGSSSSESKKEVKFISAKNEEKLKEMKPRIETPAVVKRTIGAMPKEK